MPITPLPVFEADADPRHRGAMTDEEIYRSLEVPKTLVVKFGAMKLVAEFPYDGDVKPGCGTKLVARTHRGTELVEMLTTTCENAGCSKSVSRQEMLEYIENSGGRDFPFHTEGRVLRVASIDDLNRMSALQSSAREWVKTVKQAVAERAIAMKIVEVEPILGEEVLTIYFMSEERIDFRELVRHLASHFKARIEMRQVGARDEARLVADYERCGQHCCCKNFLKVLKPISMRAAKEQKATLDPLKISGRCGRLMCCLRYEDQTYKDLKARLPRRKQRVGTSEGPGIVIDSKILAQLALVQLEHNGEEIAVPVEELMDPDACPQPGAAQAGEDVPGVDDPLRGFTPQDVRERRFGGKGRGGGAGPGGRGGGQQARQERYRARSGEEPQKDPAPHDAREEPFGAALQGSQSAPSEDSGGGDEGAAAPPPPPTIAAGGGESAEESGRSAGKRKRRGRGRGRRGRRGRGGGR